MTLIAAREAALATRLRDEAGTCRFYRSTYIGSDAGAHGVVAGLSQVPADSLTPYPVAYQIELDPHSDLDVHFHRANQFQVFVQGNGTLGRHAVEAVTVHYAGAYTAYGPIRPGAQGLCFITMRDAWDPGARFLPLHRDELRLARVARREALATSLLAAEPSQLMALQQANFESLLSSDNDALAVWSLRLPPEASFSAPTNLNSGGQFWLVLGGALQGPAGECLGPLSCLHVGADERAAPVQATSAGLHLLVLRLPRRLTPIGCTRASDAVPVQAPCG